MGYPISVQSKLSAWGFDSNELPKSFDYKTFLCGDPKPLEQDSSCFHLWFANRGYSRVRALDEVAKLEAIHHFRKVSPVLHIRMQPEQGVSENKRPGAK